MLTNKNLTYAAWLSLILAVILIPASLIELIAADVPPHRQRFVVTRLALGSVIPTIISIYLLYLFRLVLNQRANFHGLDSLITVFIWVQVVGLFVVVLFRQPTEQNHLIILAFSVIVGVLGIIYGVKLLGCGDSLFGMRKNLAYADIATGVLMASIAGLILAPIAGTVALIFQSFIFFRAARVLQTHSSLDQAHSNETQGAITTKAEEPLTDELEVKQNAPLERYPLETTSIEQARSANQSQPKTPSTVKVNAEPSVKEKLAELKEMFDDGLISQEDYENKKSDILDRF